MLVVVKMRERESSSKKICSVLQPLKACSVPFPILRPCGLLRVLGVSHGLRGQGAEHPGPELTELFTRDMESASASLQQTVQTDVMTNMEPLTMKHSSEEGQEKAHKPVEACGLL